MVNTVIRAAMIKAGRGFRHPVLCAVAALATLSGPLVAAETTVDHGFAAMMAQHDGDFAGCARHADIARRERGNTYRMHRLFVACTVNAAEDAYASGGDADAFVARLDDAIAALELIRQTPGAYHQPKGDEVLEATIDDLKRRIALARAGHKTH